MVVDAAISGVAERMCGPDGPPVLRFDFEGAPLTAVRLRGRSAFLAAEVGRALGYAGPSDVGELVTDEWRAEFTEGRDFDVIRGRDLRDLKQLVQRTGQYPVSQLAPIGARARACMLLYERGLDGVIMKTDKPAGVRMRAWLRDEVLPKLRRGEGVPAAEPAPVQPELPLAPKAAEPRLGQIETSEEMVSLLRGLSVAATMNINLTNHVIAKMSAAPKGKAAPLALPAPDAQDCEVARLRAELAESRADGDRLRADI